MKLYYRYFVSHCFEVFFQRRLDKIKCKLVKLCLQGGPYYDLLHSLLGAYACYRPDVGYVSILCVQENWAYFMVHVTAIQTSCFLYKYVVCAGKLSLLHAPWHSKI